MNKDELVAKIDIEIKQLDNLKLTDKYKKSNLLDTISLYHYAMLEVLDSKGKDFDLKKAVLIFKQKQQEVKTFLERHSLDATIS